MYRKIKSYYHFKHPVYLGKNVIIKGSPLEIKFGKRVNVYDNCIFELTEKSTLHIGDRCLFSFGVLISCNNFISIGNYVMVGEYTSIRDTTHSYDDLSMPMMLGKDKYSTVTIGNDVWIGRGCIIMPGSVIGDGVVVGANSIVKGNLVPFGIYAGSPAKLIKMRSGKEDNYEKNDE